MHFHEMKTGYSKTFQPKVDMTDGLSCGLNHDN